MQQNTVEDGAIPEAPCRLIRSDHPKVAHSWVVIRCPFCGKKHYHGGGPGDGDPRNYLGERAAHCVKLPEGMEFASYLLVEKEGLQKGVK